MNMDMNIKIIKSSDEIMEKKSSPKEVPKNLPVIEYEKVPNEIQKEEKITVMGNRCAFCKKKSHILIECKCDSKFCISHLSPELHECVSMEKFRKESFERNRKNVMDSAIKESRVDEI
jgi:predicted nucleic acid binding AN1-type Zn finger protein